MAEQSVLMACDFFFPNVGGVEAHLHQLAQCLALSGHRVTILTHDYASRSGVRYLTSGVKVLHVPRVELTRSASYPSLFALGSLVRNIIIREHVTVVHAHTTFSAIALEAVLHAKTIGVPAVFTDHSLFGFADLTSVLSNKLLRFVLHEADHAICVSHTAKENTVLRSGANPERVSVIPNAVDTAHFYPSTAACASKRERTVVVVLCRLAERKGVDMLVSVIPGICRRNKNVDFLVGGSGPREWVLQRAFEAHGLEGRVKMLGHVIRPQEVLDHGDVFLNISLTESFCMAALEAAACGLLVVSTSVGGIPEILPEDMMLLAEPNPDDVISQLEGAVEHVQAGMVDKHQFHERMKRMYSWEDITRRTERVYAEVVARGADGMVKRLRRLYRTGSWYGKILCCVAVCDALIMKVLQAVMPEREMDEAPSVVERFANARWTEARTKSTCIRSAACLVNPG
jgi:phosphatidylinositol glycan class A protein